MCVCCSSQVTLLKSLGCDRVINYKTEQLADVLKKEYPKGYGILQCVQPAMLD